MHPPLIRRLATAATVLITVVALGAAPAEAAITGSIAGQVTNSNGTPATDVFVQMLDAETWSYAGHASTDPAGHYSVANLAAGSYLIEFSPVSGPSQYFHHKVDITDADPVPVAIGEATTVNEQLLPTGTVRGQLRDVVGNPAPDITIRAIVKFDTADYSRYQYFDGRLEREEADLVTVQAGTQTRITDRLLPTGSIRVTALDAVTGTPVADFCANSACSQGTGQATVTDLPIGNHVLWVGTEDGRYFSLETDPITVLADQTTAVTVRLRPAATVTTTVVDAQTGAPVANVCLYPMRNRQVTLYDSGGACSDQDGRVTVGLLKADTYRLFAIPAPPYGRQWVGATGGTGDERQAAPVIATAGKTVTAPTIRLDRAGSVSGRVTSTTGTAFDYASVSLFTFHPGAGRNEGVETDQDGRYTYSGLGPYDWPLYFAAGGVASRFSGDTANRYAATKIKITAGGTATYNMALTTGMAMTGTVRDRDGQPANGWLIARNGVTGDFVGAVWVSEGRYSMKLLGQQGVGCCCGNCK